MTNGNLRQRSTQISRSPSSDSNSSSGERELATFTPPTFSIKELLDAIPKHCFERSALISSAYLARDFLFIGILASLALHIGTWFGSQGSIISGNAGIVAKAASWLAYWFVQGLVMTGVWVIAHECGHQAYSPSKFINNSVGWVLHSALLVPYHSWRISHAKHHAATGHMTRDQVFVPKSASQIGVKTPEGGFDDQTLAERIDDILEDSPLYVLVNVLAQQLVGWPAYLIRNASGQKSYPRFTNHFNPESFIFDARHYWQIIWSDIGLALAVSALFYWARQTSWSTVIAYYGIPYLCVNHWLVLITFLQHTDPTLPHYRQGEWNFQRGALCTQDRHVYDFLTHEIASSHVAHHLKSSIPWYHGEEATEALKKVLGDHYRFTNEHWAVSLYKIYKTCRFVDDEGDVVFFRNAKGQSQMKWDKDASDSGVEMCDETSVKA